MLKKETLNFLLYYNPDLLTPMPVLKFKHMSSTGPTGITCMIKTKHA